MKSLWNIKKHKVDKKWKSLPHIPIIKLIESQKHLLCFSYCYYRVPPQTRTLTKIYFCWQLVIRSYRATCSEPFLFTSVYACAHISGRFPYNIILFQDKNHCLLRNILLCLCFLSSMSCMHTVNVNVLGSYGNLVSYLNKIVAPP